MKIVRSQVTFFHSIYTQNLAEPSHCLAASFRLAWDFALVFGDIFFSFIIHSVALFSLPLYLVVIYLMKKKIWNDDEKWTISDDFVKQNKRTAKETVEESVRLKWRLCWKKDIKELWKKRNSIRKECAKAKAQRKLYSICTDFFGQ